MLCACSGLLAWWLAGTGAHADPPVATLTSTSVICPPLNLSAGSVNCGSGYRTVKAETESATAVYFGGAGMTGVNYTVRGLKRCTTCNNGTSFDVDVNYGQLKCFSDGTTDAGVTVAVICGQ